MPRGPRALVFDFDGVIADDEPLHLAAFQRTLAAEGITLSAEAYYARYLGFDDHDAIVEAFREAGRPLPPDRVDALMAAKAAHFLGLVRDGVPIFPGVPEFVRAAAARVPLAIASGALRREIELILAHGGLTAAFTAIVSAEDVDEGKPSPDAFPRLLELPDQRRQHGEVALLGVGAHGGDPAVHRLHEPPMGGRDLSVEVLLEQVGRARAHGRASIETAVRRFNARAALALVLLAAPVAAVEIPGTAGHLTAGGYVDGLAVAETEGGKRERPQALLDLRLDGTVTRSLRGHLELRERAGGPFEGGPGAGVYDWSHVYEHRAPSTELSQPLTDLHLRRAALRIGVQKVAWGKLDGIPPTDLVNPRDYHDPLVEDFEERKIGIPAVNATYYLPDVARLALTGLRATLVWVPIAVPPRLALLDERWFPATIRPPAHVVVSRSALARAGLPSATGLVLPVMLRTENHRPPRRLDAGGLALRLGGTVAESDWDLYHYTGPETGPDLDPRPALQLLSPRPMAA